MDNNLRKFQHLASTECENAASVITYKRLKISGIPDYNKVEELYL